MSTLNVADINAGMVNVTTGGLKLSNHNGSGNYPNPDTGMLIYDTAAGGVKLYDGSKWDSMGGGELASGTRSERESGASAANFRYNTQDGQHEYYFNNPYSNKSQALWVPMGGRQLIAFEERAQILNGVLVMVLEPVVVECIIHMNLFLISMSKIVVTVNIILDL